MTIVIVLLGVVAALILTLILATRTKNSPTEKTCVTCGAEANFGYSEHAEEDLEKIKPLCLKCLVSRLEEDYSTFTGQAVVIQPAEGPPCYVFQPVQSWKKHSKKSKIADEAVTLLDRMEPGCLECGQKANYVWVESRGLNGDNFGETLDKGLSETLLVQNPRPISLCPACCVARIVLQFEEQQLSYLEVASPRGNEAGFVVPMGY
jgi:hypothetical protein